MGQKKEEKRNQWNGEHRNLGFGGEAGHQGCCGITSIVLLDEADRRVDQKQGDNPDEILPVWGLPLLNRTKNQNASIKQSITRRNGTIEEIHRKQSDAGVSDSDPSVGKGNGHDSGGLHHP